MIILEKVNCSGAFSFGLCPTISLENIGTIFVRGINKDHGGSSNGAGKSSILNVIKEIIYEENDTEKSGPQVINKHKDWNNGYFMILWFRDSMSQRWRISSIRKWKDEPPDSSILSEPSDVITRGGKYQGSDLFLDRWDGENWVDERPTSINNKTTSSTRDRIIEIIGMTYEQFSAYVCLGQQSESALVSGTSGEREKIIQAVTDVSLWERAVMSVNKLIDTNTTNHQQLVAKFNGLDLAVKAITVPSLDEIDFANYELEMIKNEYTNIGTLLNKLLVDETITKNELEFVKNEVGNVNQELDLLNAEERWSQERLQTIECPEPPEIAVLSKEISDTSSSVARNNQLINKYRLLGEGDCSMCGQKVTQDHLNTEIGILETNNQLLSQSLALLVTQKTQIVCQHEHTIKEARNATKQKFEHEMDGIRQAREKLIAKTTVPMTIEMKLEAIRGEIKSIRSQSLVQESKISSVNSRIKMLTNKINEYKQLNETLAGLQAAVISSNHEIDHLSWVSRNLKKIKLTEYESAIERLNILLDEELYKVWGPGLTARFVTAKDKAKGGIKQEIDLMVYTPNVDEVPIEMHSGGEKKAVVIATFKAMKRLAHERGLGINLAAIDEIDKDLDDANTDRLIEAFESIANDSPSCIVISHNARLLNTMQFDGIWTVLKSNEFSTIELGET